jgi:hypothetical protein
MCPSLADPGPASGGRFALTSAEKLGDFFQYVIEKPVTLPRQKSALLPIVGKDVEASRVSIYNEAPSRSSRSWA